MKRFTETEKWRDPWFQKLDTQTRTLWLWLCDRVDNAGVVDICWPICNAETGGNFSEADMQLLGEKVERLETGKWWIPKFVHFQFGDLSAESKVHQSIEKLLSKHTLSHRVSHRVCNTLKEKDKDKDKVKAKENDSPEVDGFLSAWNESGLPKCVVFGPSRKAHLKARFKEPFFKENWVVAISRVKSSSFCNGGGSTGWKADVDWFLRPDSVPRIMEGKYDNKNPHSVSSLKLRPLPQ